MIITISGFVQGKSAPTHKMGGAKNNEKILVLFFDSILKYKHDMSAGKRRFRRDPDIIIPYDKIL